MNRHIRVRPQTRPPVPPDCIPAVGCANNCGRGDDLGRFAFCSASCSDDFATRHDPVRAHRRALESAEVYDLRGQFLGYVCSDCGDVLFPVSRARVRSRGGRLPVDASCANHPDQLRVVCVSCRERPRALSGYRQGALALT